MTEEEKERVREATDLVGLVGADMELRQRGGRWWGLCPFHEERTPSLMVDEHHFHCFGCGAHGDAYEYVMRTRGLGFPEAASLLAERAGIEISTSHYGNCPSRERIAQAVACVAAYAHDALVNGNGQDHARMRSWLAERGVGDDAIARWNIGYTPGNDDVPRTLARNGFGQEEIRAAGLLDAPRHAVTVLLEDPTGHAPTLAFERTDGTGRTCVAGMRDRRATSPFGLQHAREAMRQSGVALVTLGPLEVVALHEVGHENAVSTLGSGLDVRQARQLVAAGAREAALLYPDNEAGERDALGTLTAAITQPCLFTWVPTTGPIALPPAGERRELVDVLLDRIAGRHDTSNPQGLLECVKDACETFRAAASPEGVAADLLARRVAARFGVRNHGTLVPAIAGAGPIGWSDPVGHSTNALGKRQEPRDAMPHARIRIPLRTSTTHIGDVAREARGAADALARQTSRARDHRDRSPPLL